MARSERGVPGVFIVDEPCFLGRNARTGELIENVTAWPTGLAKFSDYLEARNMSLGIYTDAGDKTCQGCPGSKGFEQIDLTTFVRDFGARYVKVDRCFAVDSETVIEDLPETFGYLWAIPRVLGDLGDGVQISLILAGTGNVWAWGGNIPAVRHWRTTQDVYNDFGNIVANMDAQQRVPGISTFAGPSKGWNDLDMMHVGFNWGKASLSDIEAKSEITFKTILKSPYLLSCDVAKLTKSQLAMLAHPEVLAIHQDDLGSKPSGMYSGPTSADVSHQECVSDEIAGVQHRQLKWDAVANGTYARFRSYESGMCLSVAGCSAKIGTSAELALASVRLAIPTAAARRAASAIVCGKWTSRIVPKATRLCAALSLQMFASKAYWDLVRLQRLSERAMRQTAIKCGG